MYSFSCSGFVRVAGVPFEDHFSSTDDIQGYAHIHSDSQQVSKELKSSFLPFREKGTKGKYKSMQCPGHTCAKVPISRQAPGNIS